MTSLSLFTFMHWRRKWQPTPVFLPGESQGRGSLVGCRLWGCTESDTTEATYQQQQQASLSITNLVATGPLSRVPQLKKPSRASTRESPCPSMRTSTAKKQRKRKESSVYSSSFLMLPRRHPRPIPPLHPGPATATTSLVLVPSLANEETPLASKEF